MSTHAFRYLCGLTVLLSHIIVFIILSTTYRFSNLVDQVGSILIAMPITLYYVTPFIKYVVASAENKNDQGGVTDVLAAMTMYIIVASFCLALLFIVIRFSYFSNYELNEFKMWLGAVESAFGALIGIVFEKFFGLSVVDRGNSEKQAATEIDKV
ncbi:hypothetical protein ABLE93_25875 [Xanthobacter sp. KR7-65]|uniref:hypothetical protein n=1 Tax=Xanthobacter sp. KR7-65 TaxID=3156612 RepID=UPI0032B37373